MKCPPKPKLRDRPLISDDQATSLMGVFKILANDTRLKLLHSLILNKEMCVTDLADAVKMKPQALSNQLQSLTIRGILGTRRNGTNIYYRILDPCVVKLIDRGWCLMEETHRTNKK